MMDVKHLTSSNFKLLLLNLLLTESFPEDNNQFLLNSVIEFKG